MILLPGKDLIEQDDYLHQNITVQKQWCLMGWCRIYQCSKVITKKNILSFVFVRNQEQVNVQFSTPLL